MTRTLLLYDLKLNILIFSTSLNSSLIIIYTDIYCKLSKCIGQTPCLYEHYLVLLKITFIVNSYIIRIIGVVAREAGAQLHQVPFP